MSVKPIIGKMGVTIFLFFIVLLTTQILGAEEGGLKNDSSSYSKVADFPADIDYANLWDSVMKALKDSRYEIVSTDKGKGEIVTDVKTLKIDDFLKTTVMYKWWEYSSSRNHFEISIIKSQKGYSVHVKANIEEHMARLGTISRPSNGRLESELLEKVKNNLR